ncbi:glycoside hydrolase [Thelonectria olida]|uniref:Glycoside hydrolase n=1 Tax=Thelonectria olida TaxID=1576542 RepID=A0A9P8W3H8_9HYPO|nr:glycoside hydrolase [Thelonectria olida]
MRQSLYFWAGLGFLPRAIAGVVPRAATEKPVFAHYMVGNIDDDHTRQDITDAQSLGINAFAINFDQYAWWSNQTVDRLFSNADDLGFKIFFSFDMSGSYFSSPDEYATYLEGYLSRDSYYKYNGVNLVSTFGGESVTNDQWSSLRDTVGDILIVPAFYQSTPSTPFFDKYSELDGLMNWNSWPQTNEGRVVVSDTDDKTYQQAAQTANKLFMMGVSPLQFKHLDSSNNWYRRGEQNLEYRFGQVLEDQPDMIELQTWNDAGESHYMGNIWFEASDGSFVLNYTDGYDHTGYWEVLPAFIQAWKRGDTTTDGMVPTNGKAAQGVFWHHTLLTGADCSLDAMGKPDGVENVEDSVTGIVLVAEGQTGLTVSVSSGSRILGTKNLTTGFNRFTFSEMTTGTVTVEVLKGDSTAFQGSGRLEVVDSSSLCNYNYQVVALS